MNKKGFTLVELLAVIIILSLLALLASTSVTKIVTNSKNELYSAQISLIEEAAKSWGADNLEKLPSENGQCEYITLRKLKEYGLLEENIINPKTNKNFSDDLKIKITSNTSVYDSLVLDYEVDPVNVSGCKPAYVCELVNDADNSKSVTAGDKYSCEVKEGTSFNFYVLNTPTDDNINLIMERNICEDGTVATAENICATAWMSQKDYELAGGTLWDEMNDRDYYGPVTAMNYTYKATKDWYNVPNIVINYSYGGYYGGIKTTDSLTQIITRDNEVVTVLETERGYVNLKARLPLSMELKAAGCREWGDDGEESCPTYLMDYLTDYKLKKYSSLTYIPGIYGYFTFPVPIYATSYYGALYDLLLDVDYVGDIGVRPVITIPKSELG